MAFESENFKEVGGPGNSTLGGQTYSIFSTTDSFATIIASGYFNSIFEILNVRDTIIVSANDDSGLDRKSVV